MSYFGGSERKTNMEKRGTPSPCQYMPSLNHSNLFACAPFGSTQKLNRSLTMPKPSNPESMHRGNDDVYSFSDLNVKIKPEQQTSSVFKSATHRFKNNIEPKPGPGQYELRPNSLGQSRSLQAFPHNYHLNVAPTVPSIPVDNLGFRQDEQNAMKKVQPTPLVGTEDSFCPQSSLNPKGVTVWKPSKTIRKQPDVLPGPGDYNHRLRGSKSVSSCFASTSDRFGTIRKVKQTKIPGPGYYNSSIESKNNFNKNADGFFNSKTTRFQRDIIDESIGPGAYFNEKHKSASANQIRRIISKEEEEAVQKVVQRQSIFEVNNKNPGPGQYRTNYGISYQLQKMLLKKQTIDVLPKSKREVFETKNSSQIPGPGAYQTPVKQKKTTGKLWKKTEVVNLKGETEPTPSPADYKNVHKTIEQKVKMMNSKLTLTEEKAFNSGTERFKHYSQTNFANIAEAQEEQGQLRDSEINLAQQGESKRVKRLVMTMIKVRVPFGISSNKYEEKTPVYDGPDFYNRTQSWVKPSFNIKGKLK